MHTHSAVDYVQCFDAYRHTYGALRTTTRHNHPPRLQNLSLQNSISYSDHGRIALAYVLDAFFLLPFSPWSLKDATLWYTLDNSLHDGFPRVQPRMLIAILFYVVFLLLTKFMKLFNLSPLWRYSTTRINRPPRNDLIFPDFWPAAKVHFVYALSSHPTLSRRYGLTRVSLAHRS